MSGFAVPYSSSPPSTPDSRLRMPNGFLSNLQNFTHNFSTTPAAPPPSSAPSFTPAGPPPPPSLFGSSQASYQKKLMPSFGKSFWSSPPHPTPFNDEEMDEEDDGEQLKQGHSESWERSIDDSMEVEDMTRDNLRYFSTQMQQSTPRGVKRSRGGAPKKDSPIPAIAKDMATQKAQSLPNNWIANSEITDLGVQVLSESDAFMSKTEASLCQLHAAVIDEPSELEASISAAVEGLSQTWHSCRIEDLRKLGFEDSEGEEEALSARDEGVLPDESDPDWYKATSLATLLLRLHHPPPARGLQALAVSRMNRIDPFSTSSNRRPSIKDYKPTAHPKLLLDWLDRNNRPFDKVLENIYLYDPNPTAHGRYWDMILSLIIRGQIAEAINLFEKSNFEFARTARDDGHGKTGYEGIMLKNVDRVVKRAVQVLELCPALQTGSDWDVAGSDWALFRRRVEQAKIDLRIFAEGRDRDMEPGVSTFEAPNFGIRVADTKITRSARRAESQVPWSLYQELQTMYGILIGETTEIISSAQDWMEATIGLAAWWDGEEDDKVPVSNLAMTRRSLRKTQMKGSRLVDINPTEAYLQRLSYAFQKITDNENEGMFQISSISPVEVGLASIFEGNVEGVIGLLRGLSLPVASATVEIASLGGWYDPGPSNGLMENFDESDLLVLSSYGQRETAISHDSIMIDYAEKLVEINLLGNTTEERTLEGWELSTQMYSRLQDKSIAEKKLLSLVKKLPLTSERRVDKMISTCKIFGMESEGFEIAERYGDSIAEHTDQYGTALMYYARSHSKKKVKNVFDLLISLSLIQSIAFPPSTALDRSLKRLLSYPEQGLGVVAFHDQEAAGILHFYLTGYATLRKFYDLRDEESNLKEGEQPRLRPFARKRAAAATLIALISSASDSIYGGLYDESRDPVVHVDGLLALLGEAMVFINQRQPILTQTQNLALLSAIESLETVTRNIYMRCEDCFTSTLSSYYNSQSAPNPQEMMRKTVSSLTSSSGFSLVGSEMLGESVTSGGGSGSMVKLGERQRKTEGKVGEVKRGWDWRKGVQSSAKGEDILRVLRLALAKDMARAWVEGSS